MPLTGVLVSLERSSGETNELTNRVSLLTVLAVIYDQAVSFVDKLYSALLAEVAVALLEQDLGASGLGCSLDLLQGELVLL